MTAAVDPKRPRLKRDWIGRKVRSRRQLSTRYLEFPAGTIFTVTKNHGGLAMTSEPCSCCGVKGRISDVPEHDVDLLER